VDPFDEALLTAAQRGERAALEQLLSRVERLVYRFGLRMCRDEEDARAVLQETLLALARDAGAFAASSSLTTALYRLARRFCLARQAERPRAPGPPVTPDTIDPVNRAVDDAIAALASADREVLLLRDAEGLTAPEVAAVLDADVAAVTARLHRARLEVRQKVAARLGADALVAPPGCPDAAALLSQHLEDELEAGAWAAMETHLEGCVSCRATVESLRLVLACCRRSSGDGVPAAVQHSVRAALLAR
jgi:RNA polymerase sigma-70 factor (ECF subfamily)